VGIITAINGKSDGTYFVISGFRYQKRAEKFQKSLHPSRQSLEKPLNKGKLPFYLSLDLSHISPFISPVSRTLLYKEENLWFNTLKKSAKLCGKTCM
jgi:hypothetical protein